MLHPCAKPPVHPRWPRNPRGRCRVPSGAEIGSWHRERLALQHPQRHSRAHTRLVPSTKPEASAHPQPLFLPPPGTTGYRAQVTSSCGVTLRQMPPPPQDHVPPCWILCPGCVSHLSPARGLPLCPSAARRRGPGLAHLTSHHSNEQPWTALPPLPSASESFQNRLGSRASRAHVLRSCSQVLSPNQNSLEN